MDEHCEVFDHVGFFICGDAERPRHSVENNAKRRVVRSNKARKVGLANWGSNMAVICEQRDESAVAVEDAQGRLNAQPRGNAHVRISVRALRIIASFAPDRRRKVIAVRRQLADGTYDLDGRIHAAFDRLLRDIMAEHEPGGSDRLPSAGQDYAVEIAT